MVKPKVFISSTIYDFQDMRSALKYWLEEFGYDVLMSECCDFDKDSSKNSYDACLGTIMGCDYFILLIGGRVGGWYDKSISITRKEYQTAYDAAQQGHIKRIFSFVRQSIWDVLEDRQSLVKVLEEMDIKKNGQCVDKKRIVYHDSKLAEEVEHIKNFMDEVARKSEFKKGEKPNFNWINGFNSFEDIVNVLTIELGLKVNLVRRVSERNIKHALARNLASLTEMGSNGIIATFLSFDTIRKQMVLERELAIKNPITYQIRLDRKELRNVFEAIMFYDMGVHELDTMVFEDAINSGRFLTYNITKEEYIETGMCTALRDIIYDIKRLQRHTLGFDNKDRLNIMELSQKYKENEELQCLYPYHQLSSFVVPYECKYNIMQLTQYLYQCMREQDDSLVYPLLLRGMVEAGHPTEEDILEFFEKRY